MTKDELLISLGKLSSPRYPRNVYKERLFAEYSVRWVMEKYRSGEITAAGVFARLGERAGLFVIALSEGYGVADVARVFRISSWEVRQSIAEACYRAKMLSLIPEEEEVAE